MIQNTANTTQIDVVQVGPNRVCFVNEKKLNRSGIENAHHVADTMMEETLSVKMMGVLWKGVQGKGDCFYKNLVGFTHPMRGAEYHSILSQQKKEAEYWKKAGLTKSSTCHVTEHVVNYGGFRHSTGSLSKGNCRVFHAICDSFMHVAMMFSFLQCCMICISVVGEQILGKYKAGIVAFGGRNFGYVVCTCLVLTLVSWMYYSFTYLKFMTVPESADANRKNTIGNIDTEHTYYGPGMSWLIISICFAFYSIRQVNKVADYQFRLYENDLVWKVKRPLDCPASYSV